MVGAGENGELTARALSERGVRDLFRRQPPLRPRHRPGPAIRWPRGAFEDLPQSSSRRTSWSARTGPPHQIVGRDELELRGRGAHGPAPRSASTSPCRATSTRRARPAPGSPSTTWTTSSARWPATCACGKRRPTRRARSSRRRSSASRAGWRRSTSCPPISALRREATRSSTSSCARTSPAGSRCRRPTASVSARWPAPWSAGCCTSRRCASRARPARRPRTAT